MKRKKVNRTTKKRRRQRRRFLQHVEQLELRAGPTDLLGVAVGAAFLGDMLLVEPIAAEYSFVGKSDDSKFGLESASRDADTPLQTSLTVFEPVSPSIVENPGATLVAGNPNYQPGNRSAPSATIDSAIGTAMASAGSTELRTIDDPPASASAGSTVRSASLSSFSSIMATAGIQGVGSASTGAGSQNQPTGTFDAAAGGAGPIGQQSFATASSPVSASQSSSANGTADGEGVTADLTASESTSSDSTANSTTIEAGTVAAAQDSTTDSDFPLPESLALVFPDSLDFSEPPSDTDFPDLPIPGAPGETVILAGPETEIITPHQQIEPGEANTFAGEFVVQLQPEVSSEALAADFGFVHSFSYPNTEENLNVWRTPDEVAPGTRLFGWMRTNADNPERIAQLLESRPEVLDAYPVYKTSVAPKSIFNDPLLPAQWHLFNVGQSGGTAGLDGNVQAAWDLGVTGKGVTIGIVDDGLQYTHPDLGAPGLAFNTDGGNFVALASYDFNFSDDDPSPTTTTDFHGTAVAGVAAAIGNNGIGGAGVAPGANIGGIRLIAAATSDFQEAQALDWDTSISGQFDGSLIDIYSNSWGPFDNGTVQASGPLVQVAFSDSVANGRGGLGTIYTWAGGNGRANNDNVNYDGYANQRQVIAVAAVDHTGVVAFYSEPGAALLISAPSSGGGEGITTTDLVGTDGYHRTDNTDDFGGTSSATPYVSGVIALMLEVNPNLSWRDVQHILVQSAIRNDATDPDWVINGGGRPVNHNYGFGLINASGAVGLASNWQSVGPELLIDSGLETISTTIPDNDTTGLTRNITISSNIRVEHVEIIFDADHTDRGDLEVILTSPSGIESTLAEQRGQDSGNNYQDWVFSSTRHWDELSAGTWSLRVRDLDPGQTGTWNTWRLRIYGTELTADTSGPRVTGITDVNGVVNGGSVSSFEVQFDEPVAPGTFTAADVSFARVGGSSISVTAVTPVDLPGIPALGTTIEGIDFNENAANGGFFSIPPDPIGAAGPNHLVSVVNTSIEWHTKSGLQQHSQALGTSGGGGFFSSLTPANNTFDPKVIYDQHADRFVVVSLERVDTGAPSPNPGNSSRVLIAVSDDSNPNGTWHFQAIDTKLTIGGLQRWFDYPGIAVDEEAIYLTGNMFAFSANGFTFGGTRLWIIDKGLGSGGLYDGATSTFTLHDVGAISGFDITTMPAQVFGTAPGTTGTWLVQYSGLSNGASEFLNLVRIDDPLGTPTFEQDFINLGSIEANPLPALPDAPQQGSSVEIETNDSRALHAVWRDDSLWMTMTIVPESGPDAGQATAHWVEIDTTTLSTPALADQGNVGGEDIAAGTHTFFPSIAVDANGNMGIGFAASGPNIFAGAYYTGRLATDAPGTVRPTGVLAAGQDVYVRAFGGPRNRWGDYSGISIDPTNEATFWVFNEYALPRGTDFGDTFMGEAQDGRWGTRWGSFSFAPTTFTVDFAPQSTTGNYRIDIGPGIEDLAGNNLNQNGNSTNGEATQDKFTEFFTLAEQFIYSNTTTGSIPDLGSLTRTISLPSVDVADLNVLLNISHVFASFDLTISLAAPGVSSLLIADRNTANGNGISNNGYLDTILDDDNLSAPPIDATTTDFHYTGQYRPTNALSAFDGNRTAGTWTLTVEDVIAGDQGTFNNFSLLVTPAGLVDVALDSVTNTDGDRDKVEVTYTVTGGTAPPFDLGVYESTDPFFNINSDPNTGTFTVTTGLTEGTHTVEIDASLFPDPSFTRNQELYSLVVVDPQHNILDQHRFNNQGILSGVTLTPDGTLYIAGNPFTANTVTLSGSTVTFNGTPISYDSGATNDVFFVGGNKADTFTATGVNENILAFMGPGNDTYTGGNLIDVVQGGPGDDILSGNNGNDRLFGLQGNDTVSGGAGDNLLSVGAGTGQTINAVGGGNDRFLIGGTVFNDHVTVWDPDGDPNNVGGTLQATVQNPVNPSGFGAVTVQSVTISGVGSSDLLFVGTGPGNDLIQLQSETPNFGSGVGNSIVGIDAVVGAGAGSDTVFGGRGSDLLFGDQFAVATAGAGDGNDTIDSRDGIQGNDTLFGAGGTNTLISDTSDVENDG